MIFFLWFLVDYFIGVNFAGGWHLYNIFRGRARQFSISGCHHKQCRILMASDLFDCCRILPFQAMKNLFTWLYKPVTVFISYCADHLHVCVFFLGALCSIMIFKKIRCSPASVTRQNNSQTGNFNCVLNCQDRAAVGSLAIWSYLFTFLPKQKNI